MAATPDVVDEQQTTASPLDGALGSGSTTPPDRVPSAAVGCC